MGNYVSSEIEIPVIVEFVVDVDRSVDNGGGCEGSQGREAAGVQDISGVGATHSLSSAPLTPHSTVSSTNISTVAM